MNTQISMCEEELKIIRQIHEQFQNEKPKHRKEYHFLFNPHKNVAWRLSKYIENLSARKNYQVFNTTNRITNCINAQKNNKVSQFYAYNCTRKIY